MANDDIVKFLLPDGTEVSNDPRFQLEQMREQMLASVPNVWGVEGPSNEEQALVRTPDEELDARREQNIGTGRAAQIDDRRRADEVGATPSEPEEEADEPADINEKLKEHWEQRQDEADEAEALRAEPQGDPTRPYAEWSGAELKAELKRRGVELGDLPDRKKATVVAALENDDKNR